MRRPINHAYSLNSLLDYEPLVDSTSCILTSRLSSLYADKDITCNLGQWLQWYAFDVIGELTYSRRLGFLDQGRDVDGIIESIKRQLDYTGVVAQMPWLDPLLKKNPLYQLLKTPTSPIAAFTLSCIRERISASPSSGRTDMLSKFLAARDKDPSNIPEDFVVSWTNTNNFAGSDTTSITLRAIFYHLLKNPATMAKLRAEIDSAKGLSNPVSWENTKSMPYLDACIKEALRIHPAASMILERVVPKGGYKICGQWLKEGTIVGANAWVVQRDQGVYGEDAEVWNPERWFTDEVRRNKMERSLLVFGGGSRVCMGKYVSLLEMHKIVPQLLKTFDIELKDPRKEWTLYNNWFLIQTGLVVKLKLRT